MRRKAKEGAEFQLEKDRPKNRKRRMLRRILNKIPLELGAWDEQLRSRYSKALLGTGAQRFDHPVHCTFFCCQHQMRMSYPSHSPM